MSRMNWDRVRAEDRGRRNGWATIGPHLPKKKKSKPMKSKPQKKQKAEEAAGSRPLPNGRPVMPTSTAPSGALPVKRVAEYLNSDPNKTAIALKNLAAGGYVIRVSVNPDRWVRVVPVEVEILDGVARPLAKKAAQ